ncbi:unnamed protein product [Calypogeia fissa]
MPYYGKSGLFTLLWGGPIFLLVFCGVIYLYLFPRSSRRPIKRTPPRSSLGTNPLLVSGPFGIVSAAELLCIVIFTLVITWLLVVSIIRGLPEVIEKHGSEPVLWPYFVGSVGIRLGNSKVDRGGFGLATHQPSIFLLSRRRSGLRRASKSWTSGME